MYLCIGLQSTVWNENQVNQNLACNASEKERLTGAADQL